MARTRSQNVPDAVKNAPPLDLTALAANVVVTKPRHGGGRFANNPYVKLVRESYVATMANRNGWQGNSIAGYHVRDFNSALRNAGQVLGIEGIGVRIRFEYTDDNGTVVETGNVREVPEDERTVLVKFTGTRRRIYLDEDQVKDAIARGFVVRNKDNEVQTDKDGNPRVDSAAYLEATQPPVENGNGDADDEDEYDEDEYDEDEDDEDDEDDDENADAADYASV
jgi:hypothetical protein